MPAHALDDFDRAILAALQENNLTPAERLAERVGLSASAVHRRIKRLRSSGVIIADVSVINPRALGPSALFIVEVTMERESLPLFDAFRRRMLNAPEVQQCYYVTGEGDFMLVLNVRSMSEYETLANRLFHDNPGVKWFRTIVVMGRIKVGLEVSVSESSLDGR